MVCSIYVNVNKTEYMCVKRKETISTRSKTLKLVDQFIYINSNISFTESHVSIRTEKVWAVIDRSYGNLIFLMK